MWILWKTCLNLVWLFSKTILNEHAAVTSIPIKSNHLPYVTSELRGLGPVHMIPRQLIALGQLTDPGVNFASVHGLTPVTVRMSFSLPWGNFERRGTHCPTPGNPPCQGNLYFFM